MKLRQMAFIALALTATVVAVAGCGRSSSGDDGGTGSSGAPASTTGFDGKNITVGILSVETGPAAVIGKPWTEGNVTYFKHVNAEGGIAGKYPIKWTKVDTGLDTGRAVQEYNAGKEEVVMYANLLGTVVTSAVLPQLERDEMVGSPGSLDSLWLHEANLTPWGAPYQIEAINGIDWYHSLKGNSDKKFCTAYQNDSYGEAAQAGAEAAAKSDGFELTKTVTFESTATDFSAPVAALKSAGCEVVLLATTPTAGGGMFGKAAESSFAPQWIGMFTVWSPALLESSLKDYLEEHLVIVGEGPEWGDTKVPGMKEMLADLKKYSPGTGPDPFLEVGYIQGMAVVQVLEEAVKLGDLSRPGMMKAVESVPKLTFDGLSGDFTYGAPEERSPPRVNTIFEVSSSGPTGLKTLEEGVESKPATEFSFSE